MSSEILAVAVDCRDVEALGRFWCAALGYRETERWRDPRGVEYVELGADGLPTVLLQPVSEHKTVKNRLHLDIAPRHGSQSDEVRRLTGLGARVVDEAPEFPWVVLADPEGNEFCVLPPR